MSDREEKLEQFIQMQHDVRNLKVEVRNLTLKIEDNDSARLAKRLTHLEVEYKDLTKYRQWQADFGNWVRSHLDEFRTELRGLGCDVGSDGTEAGNELAPVTPSHIRGDMRLQRTLNTSGRDSKPQTDTDPTQTPSD